MNDNTADRIRAALLEAGAELRDDDTLPAELLAIAQREQIPTPALIAWIHDRPTHPWHPSHFLHWCRRYHLSNATALETETQT